jgi:MurNAc alpha-1-phosphate uridylyltransferase
MTAPVPLHAMVLAAGLGLRLRPITERLPKPLVAVGGRTMLDRALDALDAVGVGECIVNTHYLGEQISAHLASRRRPAISISPERDLLDTGGGVAKALPMLGGDPFYAVNADIIWEDGPAAPALARLAAAFDADAIDALLLLAPTARAVGYDGAGDFHLGTDGVPVRRGKDDRADYVFTGVQILHPRLFAGSPAGAFSLNILYDRALAANRLRALVHDGRWFHIGTPAGLDLAEAALGAAPPRGRASP